MVKAIIRNNNEDLIYNLNKQNNISRGTLTEIHIADIHFGVLNPKDQYDILNEQFLNKIININFDILSIDGDIFDHKYLSNSDVIMYATLFVNKVVSICRMKNATLVVISGTKSHDADQLKLFYHYLQDSTIDIRIVEIVKFEYIKGAKILCIPELYGMGSDYYNYFLHNSGLYDSVFMHGEIKGAIFNKNTDIGLDSEKSPIFTIEDFNACQGLILSGHVHIPGCFNKYFYYTGSTCRFRFGEEESKGFLIVLHNLDNHSHYVHLEEVKSFRYDTINVDDILCKDPKYIIDYINKLQENGIDNIRIEFDKDYNDQEVSNIQIIRQYYKNKNNIKIKYDDMKKIQTLKVNEEILNKYKEYDYILDGTLSEYDILSRYINDKKGYKYITCEDLKNIINENL